MDEAHVLEAWMRLRRPLDFETQHAFLARPETKQLALLDDDAVRSGIRKHGNLAKVLDHAKLMDSGSMISSAGTTRGCGCRMASALAPPPSGAKLTRRSSARSGTSPKRTKSKSAAKSSPNNRMPFGSDRYGGPAYRSPPAPPGTIAKGW